MHALGDAMTEQNNSNDVTSPASGTSLADPVATLAGASLPVGSSKQPQTGDAMAASAAERKRAEALDEKIALGWTHTARFLTTASQLDQLPQTELHEIAFVGRSNAGKSTAINTLTQQKRLAFASKTPGRTQHINLFELGPRLQADALFADLPGYGYAAVARDAKLRWQRVMAQYLELRRSLTGVVLMVDSRLGFTELDRTLLAFVAPRIANGAVRLLVLLTKSDKLNRREATEALASAQAVLSKLTTPEADVSIALFSALKKKGVGDAAVALHAWCHPVAGKGPESEDDATQAA
ncbi:hypothetical protein BH09PSE5_BH09PSE5_41600 [soil metagenome]